MPITVLSPFSGRPVKVRDQDVNRAVRDEEGRIFYAVQRADGSGYYGSPTRKGSEKDEQRYDAMEEKTAVSAQQVKAEHAAARPHDATGPGRRGGKRRLLLVALLLLLAAAGAYIAINGTDNLPFLGTPPEAPPKVSPERSPEVSPESTASQHPSGASTSPDADPDKAAHRGSDKPRVNPEALALLRGGLAGDDNGNGDDDRSNQQTRNADDSPASDGRAGDGADARRTVRPTALGMRGVTDPRGRDPLAAIKRQVLASLDQDRPFTRTASGLRYRVEEQGHGDKAVAGRFVRIHYTAALYNPGGESRIIDTTLGSKPLGFVLWTGQVIRGWDEGVAGMREGERRTLIIPTELAGDTGRAPAHGDLPRADLLCEIELVEVRPGVEHRVERVGAGRLAYPGDTVELHYTASIAGQHKPFDNSRDHGRPLRMTIGAGEVIAGLELGVTGMAEGETRRIEVPSYLAYGQRGAGSLIPPDADLIYTVELLRIDKPNP